MTHNIQSYMYLKSNTSKGEGCGFGRSGIAFKLPLKARSEYNEASDINLQRIVELHTDLLWVNLPRQCLHTHRYLASCVHTFGWNVNCKPTSSLAKSIFQVIFKNTLDFYLLTVQSMLSFNANPAIC